MLHFTTEESSTMAQNQQISAWLLYPMQLMLRCWTWLISDIRLSVISIFRSVVVGNFQGIDGFWVLSVLMGSVRLHNLSRLLWKYNNDLAQSRRDDLESVGYLLSALYQGSLPWDSSPYDTWRIKMTTPGSTLFRDMDSSFLEYWKDVRTLAYDEVPDYSCLKSRFAQCWERKGFGNSPGEYDWLTLFNRLDGGADEKESPAPLGNSLELSAATSLIAPGLISNTSHSDHWRPKYFLVVLFWRMLCFI